jgi:Cu/Ag efflux protein CusF
MSRLRYALGLSLALCLPLTALADQVRGLITRIDLKKKEVVIEGRGLGPARGQMLRLRVDADTQVFVGGEPAKLEDLQIGKRVRVVFEHQGKQAVAQTIRVPDLRKVVGAIAGAVGGAPPADPDPDAAPPEPGAPATPPPPDANTVTGTLQRVALTDRELVVIGPGSKGPRTETTVAVLEKVAIKRGEGAVAFDTLKEGETVTIKTEKRKGRLTAVSIQAGVVPASSSKATPTPPAPEPPDARPPAPPRRQDRPRLRQALRMLGQVLQQANQNQRDPDRDDQP